MFTKYFSNAADISNSIFAQQFLIRTISFVFDVGEIDANTDFFKLSSSTEVYANKNAKFYMKIKMYFFIILTKRF